MNITFLIGNGFDLNLGLETSYNSFIKKYTKGIKNAKDTDDILYYFKKKISKDIGLWSSAEEAIGKITKTFREDKKDANDFSICHEDFCVKLAEYLTEQEKRIKFIHNKEKISTAFINGLNTYTDFFRETEKSAIINSRNNFNGGYTYNFINFNYTKTLEQCLFASKTSETLLGKRNYASTIYNNHFGKLINVHGTIEEDMVFGVHDISQIADPSLFDGFGDEYISQIIKSKTDSINKQNTYKKAQELLSNSHLIYIYGMSTGITDTLWWEKVCSWLANTPNTHLILHKFEAPKRTLISRSFTTYERLKRDEFLSFSKLDQTKKEALANRIHIDGSNIFEGLKNLAKETALSSEKEPVSV